MDVDVLLLAGPSELPETVGEGAAVRTLVCASLSGDDPLYDPRGLAVVVGLRIKSPDHLNISANNMPNIPPIVNPRIMASMYSNVNVLLMLIPLHPCTARCG